MSTPTLIIPLIPTSRTPVLHSYSNTLLFDLLLVKLYNNGLVGNHTVSGTVKVKNILARRRVTLLERSTLRKVAETFSDPVTGEFVFNDLPDMFKYVAIASDDEQVYNAAVADWVKVDE